MSAVTGDATPRSTGVDTDESPDRTARPAPVPFVDPELLVCPGCFEQVRCEPPGYWRVADGLPAPGFSHPDGTALCRDRDGSVAEPIEVPS